MSVSEKGVRKLNPTKEVFKLGSQEAREAQKAGKEYVKGKAPQLPEAHEVAADDGVESRELAGHSAMKTRLHHGKHNHGERKEHEDHHHAVKALKGKM
jgi:hypothetical protein